MTQFIKQYLQHFGFSSTFSSAFLTNHQNIDAPIVFAERNVRDLTENMVRSFAEVYRCDPSTALLTLLSRESKPTLPKIFATSYSPSKQLVATFSWKVSGDSGSSFVEIMSTSDDANINGYSYRKYDLSGTHGKLMGDSWFGGVSWSQDEKYIVYVAQPNVKKASAVDSLKSAATSAAKGAEEAAPAVDTVNPFDSVPDWGEKYVDVSALQVYILEIFSGRVYSLGVDYDRLCPGQPKVVPDEEYFDSVTGNRKLRVLYVGWPIKEGQRRLGQIYCYHRSSQLMLAEVTIGGDSHEHKALTAGIAVVRSPRCLSLTDNRGVKVIFLGYREPGQVSHGGVSELFELILPLSSAPPVWRLVVATVHDPQVLEEGIGFPGLFLDQLPARPFVSENEIALSSTWGAVDTPLFISLKSGNVTALVIPAEAIGMGAGALTSALVVDVNSEQLLLTASSPLSPPRLVVFPIGPKLGQQPLVGAGPRQFAVAPGLPPTVSALNVNEANRVKLFWHRGEEDGIMFNSFLLLPQREESGTDHQKKIPVIVVPHGGPHSVTPTSFIPSYAFLSSALNAAILQVNYRGSTGSGQRSVESLLGHVGDRDVKDMITALQHALTQPELALDSSRVSVVGGSHGGFLAAHLCGQFPGMFRAAALRNPVTDISTMPSISDIPDWCFAEVFGEITNSALPSSEQLVAMRALSPVAHLAGYKTPTLVALGNKDRRVPPSQGIMFHQLLKEKGVPTRLISFPDDVHAIDSPAAEAEHWLAIADWLKLHL